MQLLWILVTPGPELVLLEMIYSSPTGSPNRRIKKFPAHSKLLERGFKHSRALLSSRLKQNHPGWHLAVALTRLGHNEFRSSVAAISSEFGLEADKATKRQAEGMLKAAFAKRHGIYIRLGKTLCSPQLASSVSRRCHQSKHSHQTTRCTFLNDRCHSIYYWVEIIA